jgi:hypothetical protein
MDPREAIPILESIISRERKDGCPMAHESLIEPAVRRWRSYERRNRRNKIKQLEHRAHDLEQGLRALFPDHSYDPGCLRHLARSFAEVLFQGAVEGSETSRHTRIGG